MGELYKGLENKYLLEILLVVIGLGVVGFFIIGIQVEYVEPSKGNITLKTSCSMWDCEEPIPEDIQKGFNCVTVTGCKQECKNIGSQPMCKE